MKKTTLRRLTSMLASAVMAVTCSAMSTSFANDATATLKLTEASGAAGQSVTVDLMIETGNTCTGYDVDIEFDNRLKLTDVEGAFATETNGNVVSIINLTGSTFKDNKAASSLTFEIPANAKKDESYSVYFSRVGEISSDDGVFENPTLIGSIITVTESGNGNSSEDDENITYNGSSASLKLTEASGIAGQNVTVNLMINAGNTCTGYDFDIEFDSRLELKNVGGFFATETNGNVVSIINLTGAAFKDNKAVSSLTFEIPKNASEGDVYELNFTRVGRISSDDGDFENPEIMGTTITVLESAKKYTNHLVYVTEENGLEVSKVALRGDADMDGEVGVYDAIRIAEKMVKRGNLDPAGEFFADVNEDGETNLYDAIAICRYILSSDKSNAWGKII